MITEKNESEMLCKCKFHGRKRNSNQWWNNNKC